MSLRDDRAVSAVLLHEWYGRHIHPVSRLYLLRQGCSRVAEQLERLSRSGIAVAVGTVRYLSNHLYNGDDDEIRKSAR